MNKTINLFHISILVLFLGGFASVKGEVQISDLVERSSSAVVKIITYDITGTERGQGSAFFIAPGKILTNAHVIHDAYSAAVFSENEHYTQVTILKSDTDVDIALISVDDRHEKFLQFETTADIRPGQRVITIGNPMGLEKSISDGLVSAIRGGDEQGQIIQISAPISPGSSGGRY